MYKETNKILEEFEELTDDTHYCHDLSPYECKKAGHLFVTKKTLKDFLLSALSQERERVENKWRGRMEAVANGIESGGLPDTANAIRKVLAELKKTGDE